MSPHKGLWTREAFSGRSRIRVGLAERVPGLSWKKNDAGDPDGENGGSQRRSEYTRSCSCFCGLAGVEADELRQQTQSRLSGAQELTRDSLGVALVQPGVQRPLKSLWWVSGDLWLS